MDAAQQKKAKASWSETLLSQYAHDEDKQGKIKEQIAKVKAARDAVTAKRQGEAEEKAAEHAKKLQCLREEATL